GEEPRSEMRVRASEVLRSWRRLPGSGPDGVPDAARLRDWVEQARLLLEERGRLRVGDRELGRVLAHARPDPDGTTPPLAVRDLLERVASDDVDTGLRNGIYNRRGVTSRDPFDGGDQERVLAARFREQATGAGAWPRTRRVLRDLAEEYEREARFNDEEAERLRGGLGQ